MSGSVYQSAGRGAVGSVIQVSGTSRLRPSRRGLRPLLRMRTLVCGKRDLPHSEERSKSASRRTQSATPSLFPDMLHEGGDAGLADDRVLLAVAAGRGDAADDLTVDADRETADEDGEAALMLGEDPEGLLAGIGVLVVVRRLAVAGGGERLVHGDLHARHLAAIEAAQRDRIARGIGDAEYLGTADLLGLLLRRVEDEIGLGEAE